ncbi:MAG: transcriptional regulator with PAS, ATPase and Fis domain, partial [Dokdonia sp.]
SSLPVLVNKTNSDSIPEREILVKALIDMRAEVDMLKNAVKSLAQVNGSSTSNFEPSASESYNKGKADLALLGNTLPMAQVQYQGYQSDHYQTHEDVDESLSLEAKEKELIKKALDKHRGKRKYAAQDLGISERTLYRKIKEYDLN